MKGNCFGCGEPLATWGHLKKDCPLIELKCTRCGFKEARNRWKRHLAKTCSKNLVIKRMQLKERKRYLKSMKAQLLLEMAKKANPRHPENGDVYETIGEYSNILDSSPNGGLFGNMRWP